MNLIDNTVSKLVSAIEDLEETFSVELEESAASVTRCIKNVLWSSSCTIQDISTPEGIKASSKVKSDLNSNTCLML